MAVVKKKGDERCLQNTLFQKDLYVNIAIFEEY